MIILDLDLNNLIKIEKNQKIAKKINKLLIKLWKVKFIKIIIFNY